jgi:hypothetical protein
MPIKFVGLLTLFVLSFASHANATTIDYIFSGNGSGTLGSSSFTDADFTVTYVSDTSTVTSDGSNYFTNSSAGSFATASLSANLSSGTQVVLVTSADFPNIGFAQSQPAPVYSVNEALVNTAFESYNLASPFALTPGSVSFSDQTYLTDNGNLDFTKISSLSFEATTPSAVPLPSGLALFIVALVNLGLLGYVKRSSIFG